PFTWKHRGRILRRNTRAPTAGIIPDDLCRELCRPTLSKIASNRTARQSVRQRLSTEWAEKIVLGQALATEQRLRFGQRLIQLARILAPAARIVGPAPAFATH